MNRIESKEAFHEALKEKLSLPEHYGKNLDALHDVLTELNPALYLIFENCSLANEEMKPYLEQAKGLFADLAENNSLFQYRFFP